MYKIILKSLSSLFHWDEIIRYLHHRTTASYHTVPDVKHKHTHLENTVGCGLNVLDTDTICYLCESQPFVKVHLKHSLQMLVDTVTQIILCQAHNYAGLHNNRHTISVMIMSTQCLPVTGKVHS